MMGVGVAQVVEAVSGVVHLIHDGHGGVQRPALGQQLNQREALEGVDGGDDQHVECGGHDLGPLDLPEHLELGGAVHLGGLDEGLIHVAQGRHVEYDGLADGGGKEDEDDEPEGGVLVAQPVKAHVVGYLIEDAVVGVEDPLPHHMAELTHREKAVTVGTATTTIMMVLIKPAWNTGSWNRRM